MFASFTMLLTLAGCPAEAPVLPPNGAPPDGAAAPGALSGGPDAGGPPVGGSTTGGPPPAPSSDLSAIITGAKVTLSGTIEGSSTAQLSILAPGATKDDMPTFLAMLAVEGGSFSLDAPASYDKPLYLTVFADLTGDGPSDDDLSGVSDPLTMDGKDVSVVIKLTTDKSWTKRMPWQAPEQEGGPAGAGAPVGPPPDGAPVGGAPVGGAPAGDVPAGGAPPAGGAAPGAPAVGGAPGAPPPGAPAVGGAPPAAGAAPPPK